MRTFNRILFLSKVSSPLGCLSPKKDKELLILEEEPSELISDNEQRSRGSESITKDEHREDFSEEIMFSFSKSQSENGLHNVEKENTEPRCGNVDILPQPTTVFDNYGALKPTRLKGKKYLTGVKRKLADYESSDEVFKSFEVYHFFHY